MKSLLSYKFIISFLIFSGMANAQVYDTSIHIIGSWKYDISTGEKKPVDFDTTVFVVANYDPLYHYSSSNISTGIVTGSAVSNIFNDRKQNPFIFANAYTPYFYNGSDYRIYRTKAPFSLMKFYIGGTKNSSEVRCIDFLHTQNINEFANAGFKVRSIKSEGPNDEIHLSNLSNLSFFGHYNKNDVKLHVSVNRNLNKTDENGGYNDSLYDQNRGLIGYYKQSHPSELKNQNIDFLTEYRIVNFTNSVDTLNDSTFVEAKSRTALIVGQHTTLDRYVRIFEGDGDSTIIESFPNNLITDINMGDSAMYRTMKNRLYFKFRTGNQFITGGVENEFLKHGHKIIPDTIFYNGKNVNGNVIAFNDNEIRRDTAVKSYNTSLFGDIEINISDIMTLKFLGNIYMLGYQQGTFGLSGKITLNMPNNQITMNSTLKTWKPDYFYNNYISGYFYWKNDFNNCRYWNNEIVIRNNIKKTGIRFNYNLLNNWLYFNENAYAESYEGIVNVMGSKVFGEFDLWKFKTNNEISFQLSDNQNVIPLPKYTFYHSVSFNDKWFDNDVLHFNIGYDLHMHSSYYAYGYMPVTGVFHTQRNKKIGSYPYIDVFASIKVKRTLFFFKYEQITGDGINFSLVGRDYYSAYQYLSTGPIFRVGVTWIFIN